MYILLAIICPFAYFAMKKSWLMFVVTFLMFLLSIPFIMTVVLSWVGMALWLVSVVLASAHYKRADRTAAINEQARAIARELHHTPQHS